VSDLCDASLGHCITCADEGVAMDVVVTGSRTQCRDENGALHEVDLELVAPIQNGDRIIVHAGVAIGRLS
jgi:hydrogenase maturation factor